jgi:hypothetical protein
VVVDRHGLVVVMCWLECSAVVVVSYSIGDGSSPFAFGGVLSCFVLFSFFIAIVLLFVC